MEVSECRVTLWIGFNRLENQDVWGCSCIEHFSGLFSVFCYRSFCFYV